MSAETEHWEAVARVVFKPNSGMEERILKGSEENRLIVCTKSRVLRVSPLRVVSLDIVESFDLLEDTCETCGVGLGQPRGQWWGYRHSCAKCIDGFKKKNDAERAEAEAKCKRDEDRCKEIYRGLSTSDRAAMDGFFQRWGIRARDWDKS